MVNYIVDDLDALLDRLTSEGVRIDPKRQDESYGRFAWIYDSDGNNRNFWQPLHPKKNSRVAFRGLYENQTTLYFIGS